MTNSSASDTEALKALIRQRRSFGLKELRPDPVPREIVEELLLAAHWAPNHGQTEPWRFTVYMGEGRRALGAAFAESYRLGTPPDKFDAMAQTMQDNKAWQAPIWISLGLLPGSNPRISEVEELLAMGAAAQNIFLLATAYGLGSKWTSGMTATHPHTAAFVGLEPPARLLGFAYVGWPAVPWPTRQRTELADRARWVTD